MALRSLRLRPECANSGHCRGDGPRPP
jgi:hypothetical protein